MRSLKLWNWKQLKELNLVEMAIVECAHWNYHSWGGNEILLKVEMAIVECAHWIIPAFAESIKLIKPLCRNNREEVCGRACGCEQTGISNLSGSKKGLKWPLWSTLTETVAVVNFVILLMLKWPLWSTLTETNDNRDFGDNCSRWSGRCGVRSLKQI